MYTVEELKAAADRLAAAGTPYLGKTLYEGEGHKIIVRPYFHGTVNKELFYLLNEDESQCSDMFIVSNMETGASEDLQDYIDKVLPCKIECWESARKEEERAEQEARERAEYERFHGFTDNMTPLQKGRVVKCLDKRYRYDDSGILTRAEHVEKTQKAGGHISTGRNPQGKTEYRLHGSGDGWYIVTKTEVDYFKYLESITIPF